MIVVNFIDASIAQRSQIILVVTTRERLPQLFKLDFPMQGMLILTRARLSTLMPGGSGFIATFIYTSGS